MREFRLSGSVRGASSNGRPYREALCGTRWWLRLPAMLDEGWIA